MKSKSRTPKQLVAENKDLRARLDEAEETLRAIRSGAVDALIVSGVDGEQILMLKQAEEQIRHQASMLESVNDAIVASDAQYRITIWNAGAESLYGWKAEQVLGRNGVEIIRTEWPDAKAEEMRRTIAETGRWRGEATQVRKDGTRFPVEISSLVLRNDSGPITGHVSVNRDISERKRAEQEIDRLAKFPSENPNPVLRLSQEGIVMYANTASGALLGMWGCAVGGSAPQFWRDLVAQGLVSRENKTVEVECDGKVYSMFVTPVAEPGYVNLYGRDITERKQREIELQAIATVSAALRTARTRAEMLPIILDQLLALLRADGAALTMRDPASGDTVVEGARGEFIAGLHARLAPGEAVSGTVIASGQPFVTDDIRKETGIAWPDVFKTVRAVACVPLVVQDQVIGAVWVGRQSEIGPAEVRLLTSIADIAANAIHRETLHEQTVSQVERLQALRAIDQAISGSVDLRMTLNVILEQAAAQLQVDAAAVLLLNPHTQTLEYVAGRGFRKRDIERARVRLGDGQAGRAALERRTLSIPDLAASDSLRSALITNEGFVSYCAAPLVVKGQVQGVLEVFQRAPFNPDPDWLTFLEMLAGQAAIAIDSSQMFDGLQRSNVDLSLAYDATIEGWSRAMDLRDKETEGHTLRVTEMTERLARVMGISEEELVHVRRGALLHDIGKMGVPDSILLKPGPLTDEEWATMRKHPQHAYDMLSPIAYLHLALDIPYCHHEKWDGAGYPRGLKGEQIPFAARIFAVADVWDALRSDRPYRKGWPEEQVREYIREQAGKHFDPKVAEVFLELDIPHA